MPSLPADRAKIVKIDRGTRLDSWKEVAAYLGRGERTVKRWERERGLPAYRVPGGGRACVYAYTAELDEWLGSQKAHELEATTEEVKIPESAEGQSATDIPVRQKSIEEASAPGAPTKSPGPKTSWLLPFSALLLVFITVLLVYLVDLGITNRRISNKLRSQLALSKSNAGASSSENSSDPEKSLAHDLCLKGRFEWNQRTPDSLNRALDYFTQAIVHDAGNARAYAGLADTYLLLREYTTMPESEAYARASAAARKAIELDDSLAEAHRALAFAETNGNWDFVNGEKEFRRAIQLNPSDALTRLWYANAFAFPGRMRECLEQVNKAQELDPSSQAILADKGLLLFKAGKKQEAIELLKQVERTYPEFRSPHFYLMLTGFWSRDYPNYLAEGDKSAQAVNDPIMKDTLAKARAGFARDGERGLLQELYAAQKKYHAAGKLRGMTLARTCILMGKKEEALELMEQEYLRHDVGFLWSFSDLDFLSLKDEPKYKELEKKVNFPDALRGSPSIGSARRAHSPSGVFSDSR